MQKLYSNFRVKKKNYTDKIFISRLFGRFLRIIYLNFLFYQNFLFDKQKLNFWGFKIFSEFSKI